MTTMTQEQEQKLAQMFKYLNIFMVLMWRLGMGRLLNIWPKHAGQIMVIGHTGRLSGLKRYTPVNYTIIDDFIYCTAAMGSQSHWYKNIMHIPQVELWLPDGRWQGEVEDATDEDIRLPALRQVLIASGFAAKLFEGIDPHTMSEQALDELTEDYRLIRIRRTHPCVGPGGPGELAWVWGIVLYLLIGRLRKR